MDCSRSSQLSTAMETGRWPGWSIGSAYQPRLLDWVQADAERVYLVVQVTAGELVF